MELLVGHFRPVLDFEKFDDEHSPEDTAKMEAFCVFCDGIERNENGNQLKDMIIRANIVKVCSNILKMFLVDGKAILYRMFLLILECGDVGCVKGRDVYVMTTFSDTWFLEFFDRI